jgi:hypothetical protein
MDDLMDASRRYGPMMKRFATTPAAVGLIGLSPIARSASVILRGGRAIVPDRGRGRHRPSPEFMAEITASHLAAHVESAGFVILKKPPEGGHSIDWGNRKTTKGKS